MNRAALALSIVAVLLSGLALALALHRPADRFPLICGMTFTDHTTGQQTPMAVPCSATRP